VVAIVFFLLFLVVELKARSVVYAATASDAALAAAEKTIITQATLGSDAGLLGAARLPLM